MEEDDKENTNMQNLKIRKRINNTNNLKEIKNEKINQNKNILENEENDLNRLRNVNQHINRKISISKRGLSKNSSTSKIRIVKFNYKLNKKNNFLLHPL